MDKKPSSLGLSSGAIPSPESTAAGVALFNKNGLNHPMTRQSHVQKVLAKAEKPKAHG